MITDADPNPYSAPNTKAESDSADASTPPKIRRSIWRFGVIAICWTIGGVFYVVGLLAISALGWLYLKHNVSPLPGNILAKLSLYLSFGGAWLLAGWCFWRMKDLWGTLLLLGGVAIPFTLFVLYSSWLQNS